MKFKLLEYLIGKKNIEEIQEENFDMLNSRNQNTQSAPNLVKSMGAENNVFLQDNYSRKSILKKHEQKKDGIKKEVQEIRKTIQQFNKENSKFEVSIALDRKTWKRSSDASNNSQKKMTTFFESLVSSQKNKNRFKFKKGTQFSSDSDKTSGKNIYKQSKIDIIFSNSNCSDGIWDIDEVSQKKQSTKHQLQSSQVVEMSVSNSNQSIDSPKITLKAIDKYQVKNSDRIMQQSEHNETKSSNIFTEKHTMSTKNPSQALLNTTSSNFRKTSYYQGFEQEETDPQPQQFFTIIERPPVLERNESIQKENRDSTNAKNQQENNEKLVKASKSETVLGNIKKGSLRMQKIEQSRQKRKQLLGESIYQHPEQLGFTMGFTESNVISKSTFMARLDKSVEFREQIFEKINLYRLLNRLQYKILKYLSFDTNQQVFQKLTNEITKQKCYTLLNTEIMLESVTKSVKKYDENERKIFLQIIQSYIEKEKKNSYWKSVKEQFDRVSFLCFSLGETTLEFIRQTLPQLQQSLTPIKGKIDRGMSTESTLLFQLRLKIMKYLYYDLSKLNLAEHSHTSDIRDTLINKQRRLKRIIEQNQWQVKIPFKELLQQFKFLKQDMNS